MNRQYDLIVAGGGMSGVTAAITAAKKGLKVLLVEQSAVLGGMGTSGLITMVMTSRRYFYGFGRNLLENMIAKDTARFIEKPSVGGYDHYPYDAEAMKRELDHAVMESGVELLLYSKIIGVKKNGKQITGLVLSSVEKEITVNAKVFVDATGDATICRLAGEKIAVGDGNGNVQAPTMMAYYSGIDFKKYEEFMATFEGREQPAQIEMIHSLIPKAVEDGVLSEEDMHHPGVFRINDNCDVAVVNAGHVYGADCLTSAGLTDAVVKGRKLAYEYFNFYKKYVPGFENAYITNTGACLALRESGRVIGQYVTTFDDKSNYRKFEDAIMRFDGGAVSDVHASSADKKAYDEYKNLFAQRESINLDDYATLPFRSMKLNNTDNLIVAGRCVSGDRKVVGQIRIMGYCFMMGEAAGLAAYLAAKNDNDFNKVVVKELQKELWANGIETI